MRHYRLHLLPSCRRTPLCRICLYDVHSFVQCSGHLHQLICTATLQLTTVQPSFLIYLFVISPSYGNRSLPVSTPQLMYSIWVSCPSVTTGVVGGLPFVFFLWSSPLSFSFRPYWVASGYCGQHMFLRFPCTYQYSLSHSGDRESVVRSKQNSCVCDSI